jgi:hypothetical protein
MPPVVAENPLPQDPAPEPVLKLSIWVLVSPEPPEEDEAEFRNSITVLLDAVKVISKLMTAILTEPPAHAESPGQRFLTSACQ